MVAGMKVEEAITTGGVQASWPYPDGSAFWMVVFTHSQKENVASQME